MAMVSVIIPAYNQGNYLGSAIKSVLDQSHQEFEILVVDDGSTDNTREVAYSFADPRVRYIYQPNGGLSAARNAGIRHANGPYLSYLDSDDLFLPTKLGHLVALLESEPEAGLASGQAIPIDEYGRRIGTIFDRRLPEDGAQLLLGNPLHVGSVMVRRVWQERAGFFDERLRSYEDWDMWLRLARAGCRMISVAEPVSLYRFHTAQMTRNGKQMTAATFAVLDKTFRDASLPQEWRLRRPLAYSRAYLRAAAQAYREAELDAAQRHLRRAVELDPNLLADEGRELASAVAGWADLPKIPDRLAFLERIYNNLPLQLQPLYKRRRRELATVAAQVAFESYGQGKLEKARHAIRRAIRYQPSRLANRGVLSIVVRTHLLRPGRGPLPTAQQG